MSETPRDAELMQYRDDPSDQHAANGHNEAVGEANERIQRLLDDRDLNDTICEWVIEQRAKAAEIIVSLTDTCPPEVMPDGTLRSLAMLHCKSDRSYAHCEHDNRVLCWDSYLIDQVPLRDTVPLNQGAIDRYMLQ